MMDLVVSAGEPSGDLQGAALIKALLKINPDLKIGAVAGPRMRELPITCLESMENLQVMGFVDVALALPTILQRFYALRQNILSLNPKAFVAIDYPGFHLRMHRSLKKKGFSGQCIHYVCPTVWAWRKGRIGFMEKYLDQLLAILPFEPACFQGTKLAVEYVGHPLTEAVEQFQPDASFRSSYGIREQEKVLALFPGSRPQEITRNLPLMLEVAKRLQAVDSRLRLAISLSSEKQAELVYSLVGSREALFIPTVETYDLMHVAHLALAKSGTVTLELALHKTPTIVQYAIKPLDRFIAQKIFRISLPYYSLPNIVLQEEVFSELFGPKLTEEALFAAAKDLWFDETKRAACKARCNAVWDKLGTGAASKLAAERVIKST
ncbi:MAG TPA: lipid-A-disaccharide synthase [Chlamydiales bacterium]|jgi:lipid-A-disaccharide synthase